MDEALNIEEELGLQAFTHESLEEKLAEKAEAEMLEKEAKESEKMKGKEAAILKKLDDEIRAIRSLIKSTFGPKKAKYQEKLDELLAKVELHSANIVDIDRRLQQRAIKAATTSSSSRDQRAGESRRDYLIRKGILNPFSEESPSGDDPSLVATATTETTAPTSTTTLSFQDLRAPGFAQEQPTKITKRAKVNATTSTPTAVDDPLPSSRTSKPSPQKIYVTGRAAGFEDDYEEEVIRTPRPRRAAKKAVVRAETQLSDSNEESDEYKEEGEWEEEDDEEDEAEVMPTSKKGKGRASRSRGKKRRGEEEEATEEEDLRGYDDGYEHVYQERLKSWCAKRAAARVVKIEEGEGEEIPEWFKPSPSAPDLIVDDGFKLPGDIAQSLFDYQKTAVNWLWNLHAKQHTGGILGDEMGLGKTIQTIAFIAGLHYSQQLTKPVLVVAPATVLKQWCNEFHKWWPCLRVSILHSSGSGMLSIAADKKAEETIDNEEDFLEALESTTPSKAQKAAKNIVDKVKAKGHILISTYTGLSTYHKLLLDADWECVVLDEGHKIRNPDAKITIAAKQLRSSTRFILSGTPIQNNLRELWSLFDFVYPGKLGIYQVFNEHIAIPIKLGGYAGASNTQIHTAFKCAVVLREMISPYILRRLKADVAVLPPKQDQVLFCNLVLQQKEAYETYIKSPEASDIFAGKRDVLAGIDVLRKICNHPDLCNRTKLSADPKYDYGNPIRSGKMQIVKGLLKAWEKDNLKCLIFSQGTQMLDILEKFVKKSKYCYLRLDGTTDIKSRQSMVDQFNNNPTLQVFLLTTKVGGYGLNLTGATRIIIFDPDWNPSNDMQARERSWRLGQKHEVRIYRLLSRGTIEEKIYQRQLYKQFLTKKILEDPEQRRVFRMDDMKDLFTLGSMEHGTETGSLFEGVEKTLTEAKRISEDEQSEKVQKIAGVHKLENFVGGASNMLSGSMTGEASKSDGKSAESPSKANKKRKRNEPDKNDHILETILAQAGVHSIVEHDAIMTTSKSSSEIVEREANRIANGAREALTRSFEAIKKHNVSGQVVWTGRVAKNPRGMKEQSILPDRFLTQAEIPSRLKNWFLEYQARGKRVTTTMIMDAFNPIIHKNDQTCFKKTLWKTAEMNKQTKFWKLKTTAAKSS
ncbi:uncharacterized protein DFL_006942 [Arthrobotrys flagrans]|uniref:DNA repair and recombination protein RAD26 n=1 Tax=Arthrobotrys flagrans TaxID=97331 RepID=A0A436ZUB3_ARTFL|nr:hypothetical protein DFL_006942 [Arthrobotrys flagrans]